MTRLVLFLVLAVCAAVRPALHTPATRATCEEAWPAVFEGAVLTRTDLLPVEARFASDFPGAVAAFEADGARVMMRRITQPTRKLHPIEACLRGAGYEVKPRPALRHPETGLWGVVHATKEGRAFRVREHIVSADGAHTWTDVSAWFWDALLHRERGPWLAITVIEADLGTSPR